MDRTLQLSTTTGTGDFTLTSVSPAGYRNLITGEVIYYCIDNDTEWEVGQGQVTAGVLTRTTVFASSNANALVNFSAGTKQVFQVAEPGYIIPFGIVSDRRLYVVNQSATGSTPVVNRTVNYTYDLQVSRNNANQIAGQNYATLVGGTRNRANSNRGTVIGGGQNYTNVASQVNKSVVGGKQNKISVGFGQGVVVGGHNNEGGLGAVLGGKDNTTSPLYAVALGKGNSLTNGSYSVAIGNGNSASNQNNVLIGSNNSSTVVQQIIIGQQGANNIPRGFNHSSGRFSVNGDAQYTMQVGRRSTTNNTTTFISSSGTGASEQLVVPTNTSVAFEIYLIAKRQSSNNCAAYYFYGTAKRDASATVTIASTKTVIFEDDSTWDVNVVADNTNSAIRIDVTGIAATIRWVTYTRLVAVK